MEPQDGRAAGAHQPPLPLVTELLQNPGGRAPTLGKHPVREAPMRPHPLSLLALPGIALPLACQATTGSIQGLVVQVATGDPVAGVMVRITQARLGVERMAITDASGRFRVVLLPPETYTVELGQPGYRAMPLQVPVGADRPTKAVLWTRREDAPAGDRPLRGAPAE